MAMRTRPFLCIYCANQHTFGMMRSKIGHSVGFRPIFFIVLVLVLDDRKTALLKSHTIPRLVLPLVQSKVVACMLVDTRNRVKRACPHGHELSSEDEWLHTHNTHTLKFEIRRIACLHLLIPPPSLLNTSTKLMKILLRTGGNLGSKRVGRAFTVYECPIPCS